MDKKRRDSKKRILRTGESQRQDGKYRYAYTDALGAVHEVTSWRLTETDPVPYGKRDGPSLRELEAEIELEKLKHLDATHGRLTVVELCEMYLKTHVGFRENTKANHETTMNILRAHPFGAQIIKDIHTIDAKLFLVGLQQEQGRSYSSIHSIRGVLRPAFQMAFENEFISRNPFDFQLKDVLVNDSVTRDAITRAQERKFLEFIRNDPHFREYYDPIYLLFKIGVRISEFCGLTLKDIDLENRTINIDHQLQRKRDGTLYVLEDGVNQALAKTDSGKRCIPMLTDEIYEAFCRIIRNRKTPKIEPMVDGYTGFLFLNCRARKGLRPMVAMDWEHIFARILKKYNSIYREQMPTVTPHVCRHTCCNNLANSGMAPAHLQYYMGHSDISVTMEHYVHTKTEDTREEAERMKKEGRLKDFA